MRYSNVELAKSAVRELGWTYIAETLSIYEPSHTYLRHATWDGESINGTFTIEHYAFTKPEFIHYVTASMVMLYVSQLGYVLSRVFCDEHRVDICEDQFFTLRDTGRIVIASVDRLRFRRAVDVAESILRLDMKVDRLLNLRESFIGHIRFREDQRRFEGRLTIAVAPNH